MNFADNKDTISCYSQIPRHNVILPYVFLFSSIKRNSQFFYLASKSRVRPFHPLQRKTQATYIRLHFTSSLHQFLTLNTTKNCSFLLAVPLHPIFSIIPPSFSTSKTSNLIQDMDAFSHLRFIPQPAPICFLLPHSTKTNFTKITNHLWH